jgi:pimeloyl-ACP methyl ester carboxylesterase
MSTAAKICLMIVCLPFMLIFFLLFGLYFLVFLITLVGPLYHIYRLKTEAHHTNVPGVLERHSDMGIFKTREGDIVYRWTPSKNFPLLSQYRTDPTEPLLAENLSHSHPSPSQRRFPVCLPGGLGSTLAIVALQHEALVAAGYDVLCFDRIGVGYSDSPRSGKPVSIEETIADMHTLMEQVAPNRQWIIVGGSFGSAVGQLYTAKHPEKVAGFVNLDGLPFPLYELPGVRDSFRSVESIYKMEAMLSSIGLFRLFIWLVSIHLNASSFYDNSPFSWEEIYSQLQCSRTIQTIAFETPLMAECCDQLVVEWGNLNLFHLPDGLYDRLKDAPADFIYRGNQCSPAIEQEKYQLELLREDLHKIEPNTQLGTKWCEMAVRSLSCRNYDSDPLETFMKKEMKELYAAEHTFLCVFAKNGGRRVYPELSHSGVLKLNDHVVSVVNEITDFLEQENAIEE